MPSLLIVSADPSSTSRITNMASELNFRSRSVTSMEDAENWLSMESYNVLLVDSRYYQDTSINLITLGWHYNQFMTCGLFNFYGTVDNEWQARLIGTHIFAGLNALTDMKEILGTIPQSIDSSKESHLLFVEDLDSPRMIISSYIEGLGYGSVEAVTCADEALSALRDRPNDFFCIVSDINMPNMTGIEMCSKIREEPTIAHIPVIMLTSYATVDNLIECVKVGATGFLVKPPQKKTLRKELDKAKRIFATKQSPRLCSPNDAHQLEDVLSDIVML